jgi:hypothetical protein
MAEVNRFPKVLNFQLSYIAKFERSFTFQIRRVEGGGEGRIIIPMLRPSASLIAAGKNK